jgi:transcriptional regulator with XRE-family HTH domain
MESEEIKKKIEKIKKYREENGISQEKMAHQLGISYRTLHRWEHGITSPSKLALQQIEEFLKKIEQ